MTASMMAEIMELKRRLDWFERTEVGGPIFLAAPLTSTSWDGDAHSTEAKTKIDLSAVFGAPANIKAVSVRVLARDSASAASSTPYFGLSPNDTSYSSAVVLRPGGLPNDYYAEGAGIVPCDSNGDIYYQIDATGAGTLDAHLQIWGYWI